MHIYIDAYIKTLNLVRVHRYRVTQLAKKTYTGCFRMNLPYFERTVLRVDYFSITNNMYLFTELKTFTKISAR